MKRTDSEIWIYNPDVAIDVIFIPILMILIIPIKARDDLYNVLKINFISVTRYCMQTCIM